jgi:hypothetical protein
MKGVVRQLSKLVCLKVLKEYKLYIKTRKPLTCRTLSSVNDSVLGIRFMLLL